jgi:hypothetical protein
MRPIRILACILCVSAVPASRAEDLAAEIHAQATYIRQQKPTFPAPYTGTNSLLTGREGSYSFTTTLFLALRYGDTELYFDPEFVQGASLSGLHGLGGFSNGETQRGSGPNLRGYRARLFARHTWNLGGASEEQKSDQHQVKTSYSAERVVLTAGNLSVLDVFDVMDYSHDPRTQFMSWSSLTYGAWDYPADARGYTWGAAAEYITPAYEVRAGRFLVPYESNGLRLDGSPARRYGDVAELELPYKLAGRPGAVRVLAFHNRVNAGAFDDARAAAAGAIPDLSGVRHPQSKKGVGVSMQLELTDDIGAYVRAGWNDGKTESFMFTEIDRSLAAGALIKGRSWRRPQDSVGIASYINGLSTAHRSYLAAGGLGFFLGDGRLNYGSERIVEVFYSFNVAKGAALSAGYQHIANPGYNRDRGPAEVYSLRAHWEF